MVIIVVAVEEVSRQIIHCYQHFIYLDMIYLLLLFLPFVFRSKFTFFYRFIFLLRFWFGKIAQQEFLLFIFLATKWARLGASLVKLFLIDIFVDIFLLSFRICENFTSNSFFSFTCNSNFHLQQNHQKKIIQKKSFSFFKNKLQVKNIYVAPRKSGGRRNLSKIFIISREFFRYFLMVFRLFLSCALF